MRSRIKKMLSYIKMKLGIGSTWKKQQPAHSASNRPAALYLSCSQLPLDRFINCLVNGDLNALIISGQPSLADIAEAWSNIFAEYLDINNDNEATYLLQLQSQLSVLSNYITEIETAIYLLSILPNPALGQLQRTEHIIKLEGVLREHGHDYTLDPSDFNDYVEKLQQVDSSLAPDRLRFETLTKEYATYLQSKEGQSVDRTYFVTMLRRLARFNKVVVIRAAEITVEEFVMMVHDYLEYYNANKKEIETE